MKLPVWEAMSTVGEKNTPPRTRQLRIASRVIGRYHAASPTNRVNCCSSAEPRYFELTVISSDLMLPRDGSIGLLTLGKATVPVSVASTRFCRSSSTTSGVQALKEPQKLAAVASARPYGSGELSGRG